MSFENKYISQKLNLCIEKMIKTSMKISSMRINELRSISIALAEYLNKHSELKLIFICTHNSRRSQLAQVWAQVAAHHFQLNDIKCYSGGTETTAFHPNAVKALQGCGFKTEMLTARSNPEYRISFSEEAPAIKAFSKLFSDSFNPSADFIAIMTCSDADEACPLVPGADLRFSLPFEDPKIADATPEVDSVYMRRSNEIATEMFYIFGMLSGKD